MAASGAESSVRSLAAWPSASSALRIFLRIEGAQRAGAVAHFAFISMFAAITLCVAVASLFFDRQRASSEVITFVQSYVPISDKVRKNIFEAIADLVNGRGPAGTIASLLLSWSVMRFITTLIRAVNRAWSTHPEPWWRLALKSLLFLLVILAATPLVMSFPMLLQQLQDWFLPRIDVAHWVYSVGSILVRVAAIFLALTLFYKLAPRRPTRFTEVWIPAALATVLLILAQGIFGLYLKNFASFNAVYGALGAVVALLMWMYFSGSIFIYGACLCAARST